MDAREDGLGQSRRDAHRVRDRSILAPACRGLTHDLERIERMPGGEVGDSTDLVTAEDPVCRLRHELPYASSVSGCTESFAACGSSANPTRQVRRALTRTSSLRNAKRTQAQEEGSAH